MDEEKDPEPEPNTEPEIKPVPEPEKPLTPAFDADAFFIRARVLMKDRAVPLIASNTELLGKNLADFERTAKRYVRRMDRGDDRDDAEEALDSLLAEAVADRNRIPKEIPGDLKQVDEFDDLHEESLEKQDALDAVLMSALRQLSATYVVGLKKQIERLDVENDAKPIGLINDEIEKTEGEANYFPNLMLGIEPEKPVAPAGEVKKPALE